MKIVTLALPAVIAGAVRYPVESPLTVTDEQAQSLKDSGRLDGDPEDLPEEGEDEADGLDNLKVVDLDKIIADEEVEVAPNANKADKVAAIRAARAGE